MVVGDVLFGKVSLIGRLSLFGKVLLLFFLVRCRFWFSKVTCAVR